MSRDVVSDRSQLAGLGFAVTAAAAFGSVAIFAKFAYREGADPLPLLATRFLLAGAVLAALLVVTGRWTGLEPRKVLHLLLLGGIVYALEAALFFLALQHAPAGTVAFLFYSYPVWTTLLALATGLERATWRLLVPLLLGTAGVGVIFSFSGGGLLGPVLALCSAVAVAVYFILAQVIAAGVPPAMSALWTSIGAGVSLMATSFLVGGALPGAALVPATGLALATVVAFVCMFAAIARIGSARVSIASTMEPVSTAVLAAVLLGELLTARVLLGAALVLAAIPVLAATSRPHVVGRGEESAAPPRGALPR